MPGLLSRPRLFCQLSSSAWKGTSLVRMDLFRVYDRPLYLAHESLPGGAMVWGLHPYRVPLRACFVSAYNVKLLQALGPAERDGELKQPISRHVARLAGDLQGLWQMLSEG